MTEPDEFDMICVVIERNPEWLKRHEKRGFLLSPQLYLKTVDVPEFIRTERDLDKVVVHLKIKEKAKSE